MNHTKSAVALLVLVCATFTVACYESAVPLDTASRTPLDPKLLSTWRCVTPNMETGALTMVVGRARDGVYAVSVQEAGDTPDRYEAHGSVVGGETLLNVRELKPSGPPDPKPWSFVRYTLLQPDILRVQVVRDTALDGVEASPAAIRRAIERQLKTPTLYTDVFACVRAKAGK